MSANTGPVPLLSEQLNSWLHQKTAGVVQSGPFQGMHLLNELCWAETSLSSQLLGCFEQELHGIIEHEISRLSQHLNPQIINIGCAEGYYAVGLARRLPRATVWALDIVDKAVDLAQRTAKMNGVNIVTGGMLDTMFKMPDFILADCEGAEVAYLDMEKWPGIRQATILVEVHNFPEQHTDTILFERFKDTHSIKVVSEGARNPNAFQMLHDAPSDVRWALVNEHRPVTMSWFIMSPKVVDSVPTKVKGGKVCGECSLCCKVARVPALSKPSNTWCQHCAPGKGGCLIYDKPRPPECSSFQCLWLTSDMLDELRPDKVHLYAEIKSQEGYAKVCVDTDHPNAWRTGEGRKVVDSLLQQGYHVIIQVGFNISFETGSGRDAPERILLDWVL